MSRKLTKEAEERLIGAIEKSSALINAGESPSAAIAKAAAEDGIPPGHINLMVQAYNTGRTTRQRTEGKTPLEKAADFELADSEKVLELLYPSQVKTAAAIEEQTIVSTQYALPPTGLLNRRALREKRATGINWRSPIGDEEVREPEPLPTDPAVRMKKAYCDSERVQRQIEEARRVKVAAFDKMAETFRELTDYFRSPASTPIPVVREHATLMHGSKATQLIDEVVRVTPGLMKFSHHKAVWMGKPSVEDVSGEGFALVSQFLDDLDRYKQASHAYEQVQRDGAERQEALLRPFFDAGDPSVLGPSSMGSEKRSFTPMIYGASALTNLSKQLGDSIQAPHDAEVDKAYDALTDPQHEQQLRNIRSQAMLQDMMVNDPIISSYDPDEALNAYNEIAQLAPRVQDQQLVMQALLRKRLEQGQLDPFEVEQLIGMEEKQKKIQTPVKGLGDAPVL